MTNKKILIFILGIFMIMSFIIGSAMAAETITQNVTGFVINGTEIGNETISEGCLFETENITLSSDVNFKDCPGNALVSIKINNGSWTNYSASFHGGKTYSFILNSSLINGGDIVYWQYYAKDCYNFTYNGSIKNFIVLKRTQLSVIPWPPDGLNGWLVTEPEFSFIKDSAGGNIHYQWDSEDVFHYTSPFGLENIPNSPPKESAGILDLNWWTDFSCGVEPEQTSLFYIDLTNPVIKDLIPANKSIVYNNLRPIISAYLDEVYQSNSGIDKNSVIIKLDNIDRTSNAVVQHADTLDATVKYIPNYDLNLGEHEVYIYAKDKAGRKSELTWKFEIKTTPVFGMKVNSPKNTTYNLRRVPFNVTTSEIVEKLEYINWGDTKPRWKTLCSNCDGYGSDRDKFKSVKEGGNNVTVKATDEFGFTKEENITFYVDSIKPKISKTEPKRNRVINGSEFYIKYTEDNLKNITLFYGIGTESITKSNCESGKNKECIFSADLTGYEGQWIEYYFEVNDSINSVQSKKIRVFVDTISPVLTINMPENSADYSRKVPFNIIISENVLLEYIDNSAASPRWRRLTSNSDEYGFTRAKTMSFSKGLHNIKIRAVDEAGNSDVEAISFEAVY